ncbi:MAG: hypothetical protein ACLPY5_14645, partial [Candidatus Bathyarchaeia archaeon]
MSRIWRVQANLTMPKFARMGQNGGFPKQIKFLNIFPEQRLFIQQDLEFWLKCKESVTQMKSGEIYKVFRTSGEIASAYRDPTKWPYILECKVNAEKFIQAVDKVIDVMETITCFLSFQLQYPVKIVHLELQSPSQKVEGEFDMVT